MRLLDLFKKKNVAPISSPITTNYTTLVFDVETTGLSPTNDEILQLSMIDEHFNVLYNEYFKPQNVKSWPEAQRINGIIPKMVANTPSIAMSLNEIQMLFNKAAVIIGYNVKFDISFLEVAGIKGLRKKQIIDVMDEYTNAFHQSKLVDAAKHFNFKYNVHDSLEDVRATLFVHNCLQSVPKKETPLNTTKERASHEEYLQQKIGDKTIAELQTNEVEEIVKRNFKPGTPVFEGLHIFCNVYPAKEGYDILNDAEKTIFKAFVDLCKENDIKYDKIRMVRQSKNVIVVEHPNCWAGRFRVKQKAPKYDIYPIRSENNIISNIIQSL